MSFGKWRYHIWIWDLKNVWLLATCEQTEQVPMSFPLEFYLVVMSFPFQWFLIHLYHITLEKFSPETYVKFRGHAPSTASLMTS